MSSNSTEEVIPGKEQEKDELSMKAMMLEMQKQIASLANTVAVLKKDKEHKPQSTPQKRKINPHEPSSSNAKRKKDELENITDSEDESNDKTDGFDNLVDDINEPDCEIIEDDDILAELSECFGSDDKCGEPINEKLAKVANDGVRTKLNIEKIKETGEKYLRPKNVKNLVTPKVNEEIRPHLNRKVKNQDFRLQKTQSLVCKAIVPQLQQLDLLMKAKISGGQLPMKDMTQLAMDGLKLMTFVYCDLSYRRRELIIQPDANEEFRGLCSNDHPVTDNLFGDDLGKKVEDMIKANKVGSKISGKKMQDGRHVTGFKKHHSGHKSFSGGSNYRPHHFLGHRANTNFRKRLNTKQQRKQ
ncbi:hypothetical protein FSP39_020528 [Pinctada imbricata]|uniref:Uncharacterized protein n=1 Tax=Pinctada imbricata TaxID=66713 RepID=A0AA88XDN3_PINIB|nr:hypothetical protein FSP39_020528 [Pinctada imbricata]